MLRTFLSGICLLVLAVLFAGTANAAGIGARKAFRAGDIKGAIVILDATKEPDPVDAFFLALMYLRGDGGAAETDKGATLLLASAEQGYAPAQYLLGVRYLYGIGMPRNRTQAESFLLAAASDADYRAVTLLKLIEREPRVQKKDQDAVVAAVKKAARAGNPDAQTTLAFMYLVGDGVATNLTEELRWYRAASKKNARAAMLLSFMYQSGETGRIDLPEAARLMKLAADFGDTRAQYFLATFYYQGTGVAMDKKLAADLFRIASESGFAEAQLAYGMVLLAGDGVPLDKGKAIECLTRAAQQQNEKAQVLLKDLLTYRGSVAVTPDVAAEKVVGAAADVKRDNTVRLEGKGLVLDQGRFGLKFSMPSLVDSYGPRSPLTNNNLLERLQGGTVDIMFWPAK